MSESLLLMSVILHKSYRTELLPHSGL